MVIQRWIACRERRGQPPIHGRVHQLGGLCKQQFADVMQGESCFLHRVRHRHGLKVSSMMYFTSFAVEERVIRGYTPWFQRTKVENKQCVLELHSIVTVLSAEMMSSI
jgi:hypothetical protein